MFIMYYFEAHITFLFFGSSLKNKNKRTTDDSTTLQTEMRTAQQS